MEIRFVKMNPAQNMTVLVESEVERGHHERVAQELMSYGSVFAEQVGFIEKPINQEALARLQMMGGEFCGNATMSLAAFLASEKHLPSDETAQILLESSGLDGLVAVSVRPEEGQVRCWLELPPPVAISDVTLKSGDSLYQATMVDFDGIIHFVLPFEPVVEEDMRSWAEANLINWAKDYRAEAVGLILFNQEKCSINPLVLVKPTATLIWERGCGSGSAAVGAVMAAKAQNFISSEVSQPGGVISVTADYLKGRVSTITIGCSIKMAARGVAYI